MSRSPRSGAPSDELVAANLLDAADVSRAVAGSEVAYLTVGLPPDSKLWAEQLPTMMRNVVDACAKHGTKLVFFDNTYMYPMTSAPQTESTAFAPRGSKARTRASIATMLLDAMATGRIEALICRAPEFYGPGKTQSFTNSLVFDRIAAGRTAQVPLTGQTRRSLIWTPDASRAMALLGNTATAYGQTWHLPVDSARPTYREMIELAAEIWGHPVKARVTHEWQFRLAGLASKPARELWELLPRYRVDNVFSSEKFNEAYPDFRTTTIREGITVLADAARAEERVR